MHMMKKMNAALVILLKSWSRPLSKTKRWRLVEIVEKVK